MATKKIPKVWLDKAIAATREYYHDSASVLALNRISAATHDIERLTGLAWYSLDNLLAGILCSSGCKPDATNEDIYAVLRLLGWEVSD